MNVENNLYNDDCLNILPTISSNSIDCVLTSPPYNFDIKYNSYEDKLNNNNYFEFLTKVFKECYRILKPDGRLIINVQPNYKDYLPTHHILTNYLFNIGYRFKTEILWNKMNYNCPVTCWGSYKSPSAPFIKSTFEFIEVFVKDNYKHSGKNENIDITDKEFQEWTNNYWCVPAENRQKEFGHPAMFPEKLVERLLKLFTFKQDLVLDPFMGSGTTGVVCKLFERNFIGIEIDEYYYNLAKERIEKHSVSHKLF